MALVGACQPAAQGSGSGPAGPGDANSPQGRLSTALDALRPGYLFDATVSLGGAVATHATGRWVSGNGEFVIEAEGGELTYRTVPPRAWARADDSGWVELDSGSPLGNPLDALVKPTTLAVTGGQGGGLDLRATYPAAALGMSGDPVTVDLTLGADRSVTATYRAPTPTGEALSVTRMTPASNLEPVVAPAA